MSFSTFRRTLALIGFTVMIFVADHHIKWHAAAKHLHISTLPALVCLVAFVVLAIGLHMLNGKKYRVIATLGHITLGVLAALGVIFALRLSTVTSTLWIIAALAVAFLSWCLIIPVRLSRRDDSE